MSTGKSSAPPRTLSKGVLGLKFMNRVAPIAPPSSSSSTPVASTSSSNAQKGKAKSKTTPATSTSSAADPDAPFPFPFASTSSSSSTATASTSRYISTPSLLSFPLMSSSRDRAESNNSREGYSSMPLSSHSISGRRSFGGANKEIEILMDPSLAAVKEERSDSEESDHKSNRKGKGKKEEGKKRKRDELMQGRQAWDKEKGKKKRKSDDGTASGKKTKDLPAVAHPIKRNAQGFAVPQGYQDIRRDVKPSKGRDEKKPFDDHKWIKEGEKREWDEGKASDDEDEDSWDSDAALEMSELLGGRD